MSLDVDLVHLFDEVTVTVVNHCFGHVSLKPFVWAIFICFVSWFHLLN